MYFAERTPSRCPQSPPSISTLPPLLIIDDDNVISLLMLELLVMLIFLDTYIWHSWTRALALDHVVRLVEDDIEKKRERVGSELQWKVNKVKIVKWSRRQVEILFTSGRHAPPSLLARTCAVHSKDASADLLVRRAHGGEAASHTTRSDERRLETKRRTVG